MSMGLHTDRVDHTIGDGDNFGRIWAWTAVVIFLVGVIFFEGTNSESPMPMTGFGFHASVVGLSAFAMLFPGVMVAGVVKFFLTFFED